MRTYGSNVFGMSLLLVLSPQSTTASVIGQDPLDAHARLVAAIPDALERHNAMGAAVAIVEGGAVVWAEGSGREPRLTGSGGDAVSPTHRGRAD